MSGGSQHNPNGRQAPLGPAWNPLQLQMASYLARAPQAHLSSERGVTWHTPTPPPRLYHVPPTSPPEPLQAMKMSGSGGGSGGGVYRHAGTPPDLYRHTPTPPDKHMLRHTPSPGDVKAAAILPPADLYTHLGQQRDKIMRAEEMLSYARSVAGAGVDLSLSRGAPPAAANGAPLALSVRDAPTINSLIARAQPRHPPHHARVDQLLERLAPSPVSPHSVIVHSRAAPTPTPSPPSSNEDSADSCGAPPGAKRKRKPDRTLRVPAPTPPAAAATPPPQPPQPPRLSPPPPALAPAPAPYDMRPKVTAVECEPETPPDDPPAAPAPAAAPPISPSPAAVGGVRPAGRPPLENGDTAHDKLNGPDVVVRDRRDAAEPPHTRRKTRSGSAETIDDIAAMIADPSPSPAPDAATPAALPADADAPATVDILKSVLGSVDRVKPEKESPPRSPAREPEEQTSGGEERQAGDRAAAVAPRRRSARASNAEPPNVPVESPSEARAAETEPAGPSATGEPIAASFVEVENQLQKMFAGLEEEPSAPSVGPAPDASGAAAPRLETADSAAAPDAPVERRRSAAAKSGKKKRKANTAPPADGLPPSKKKTARKKAGGKNGRRRPRSKEAVTREAYDSGSNASGASRSRGPYIQIRGPRDSPHSVSVVNAAGGGAEDDSEGAHRGRAPAPRPKPADGELRNGMRKRGLHCSTLSLRYDATTADATWVCAFCERGPHAGAGAAAATGAEPRPLGDLFGPYAVSTDCDEFRALDEASRRRATASAADGASVEVWVHEECALWAPGVLAGGARVWGLDGAVWAARGVRCARCGRGGAAVACGARACPQRSHAWCARAAHWALDDDAFRALCPAHR